MKGEIGKWEVKAEWSDFNYELRIFIARWCEGEWVEYITKLEGDKSEIKRVPENECGRIEPTIILRRGMSDQLMQAFAECCEKNGFRPEGKPVLENELTATKFHLEDMRKLVFKDGH